MAGHKEMSLESWERHVVKDDHKRGDNSLCGLTMWGHDAPIELGHAKRCVEQDTRLQPCPSCMAAA